MTSSAPPASSAPRSTPDVRTLNLVQLQRLAEAGSRRARAELERRMRAAAVPESPGAAAPPAPSATTVHRPPRGVPAAAAPPHDARIDPWVLIERQQLERARQDGPPRLVGLVLIAWGVLLGLGGLALLGRGGGAYYLLCGLACAGVGALLMRCSRWALGLQAVAVLLALAWAWRSGGVLLAVLQAAPLWMAGLWLAAPAVREPLR
ncbi:MAG: hypothetical protein R3E52_10770 [Burkholderiaceae bacterium]